ncbi:MAG: beta-galactosidase [Rhodopirellula sp. JB044]|uniref:beta-galactosidase n=1 Tax=Rhodopirellula sp. JB044 TaxID=3342844 RepID=UPI00370A3F48
MQSDLSKIQTTDAKVEIDRSDLQSRLRLQTGVKSRWPGVKMTPGDEPWNAKPYQTLSIDVTNLSDHSAEIGMKVQGLELVNENLINRVDVVGPGQTRELSFPLYATPWRFDAEVETDAMNVSPGQMCIGSIGFIKAVTLYVRRPSHAHTLLLGDLRLSDPAEVREARNAFPIVDRYGQLIGHDWPGKIENDRQLKTTASSTGQANDNASVSRRWSRYGGWTKADRREATDAFRTVKLDGKWWLIDPDGYLFWSHGVDCVSAQYSFTGVQDREHYFAWLPDNNTNRKTDISNDASDETKELLDPLGNYYHRAEWAHHEFYNSRVPFLSYNFFIANLHRRFGAQWPARFADQAHDRLRDWGLNTMAAWSDPAITSLKRTPYTAFCRLEGATMIAGSTSNWQRFVDVYSSDFPEVVDSALQTVSQSFDDPWCIGIFVDNELSFGEDYSLADGVLRSPATQPAKIEFCDWLKEKYLDIDALNQAWKTQYADWDSFLHSMQWPAGKANADDSPSLADRRVFSERLVDRYFSTIANRLHHLAPGRLYLGCRFFWMNDSALRIAAKHCDVISINHYHYLTDNLALPDGIDKPVVIGEFHFGATDRGMLHPTHLPADDQADRASKYEAYVTSALKHPAIVGTHWFQYVDMPVTGRGDGENANVGLVTITNTPYRELTDAIAHMGESMYELRSGKTNPNHNSASSK